MLGCARSWTSRLTGAHAEENVVRTHLIQGVVQEAIEEAGKVGVEALVAGDELVGEGEPGHEQPLLQPEDGAEGAAEMDALHARKRDQTLRKAGATPDPPLRPLRLLCHTGHRLNRLRAEQKRSVTHLGLLRI